MYVCIYLSIYLSIYILVHCTQVKQFIDLVGGGNSLYGLKKETIDSLLLSLLPPYGHTYKETPPGNLIGDDVNLCLLQELLRALRNSAGFAVPVVRE